eukprot:3507743-Pleurochrysis_carterae.AAC.1
MVSLTFCYALFGLLLGVGAFNRAAAIGGARLTAHAISSKAAASTTARCVVGNAIDETDMPVLTCGNCQASYPVSPDAIGEGRKVKCDNCGNEWFQTAARLNALPPTVELVEYPEAMKKRVEAGLPAVPAIGFRTYVGNLPFDISEEVSRAAELEGLFATYGNVVGVDILTDEDGRPRGFGFVNFESEEDGKAALAALNGETLNGRTLT